MNQFEAARQKHARNLERKARVETQEHALLPESPIDVSPVESPKESPDGIVEVTVTLPSGVQRFTLVKRNVFANAVPAKLTRQALLNCVAKGLEPLLGAVKEQ
jgi:hypothetical protein